MHHATPTLNSPAPLHLSTTWSGWSHSAPVQEPTGRSVWVESLVRLAGGLAFASIVWLAVVLVVIL